MHAAARLLPLRPARVLALLVATALALALAGGGASPPLARAEHEGDSIGSLLACDRPVTPPRCTSVGNSRWHFIYLDPSVPPELAASIRRAIANYDATALVVVEQPAITSSTDAIAYASDYGANGAAGWVYCPPDAPQGDNRLGHRWCQRQEIHFNLNPRYALFFADDASRDYIACHEIGHTIGLRHWGNPPRSAGPAASTCMNADAPNGPTDLHDIDRAHIAEYYAPNGTSAALPTHVQRRSLRED